jgi:hypothetical protein
MVELGLTGQEAEVPRIPESANGRLRAWLRERCADDMLAARAMPGQGA